MIGKLNISDIYMSVLASLSNKEKLDLISKLSASMRDETVGRRQHPNLRKCFSGEWSDVDAQELRNHEYHGRDIETW